LLKLYVNNFDISQLIKLYTTLKIPLARCSLLKATAAVDFTLYAVSNFEVLLHNFEKQCKYTYTQICKYNLYYTNCRI